MIQVNVSTQASLKKMVTGTMRMTRVTWLLDLQKSVVKTFTSMTKVFKSRTVSSK